MKAIMVKKASNTDDWYEQASYLESRYPKGTSAVDVVIEKEIVLTDKELAVFESDLLEDSEIIKSNLDLMYVDNNKVWHCIALTSKNAKHKILVESEGYNYSRYTAIVNK